MRDMSRNEGTKATEVDDGKMKKTYEKPSLIEYGSIEILTQGASGPNLESFGNHVHP